MADSYEIAGDSPCFILSVCGGCDVKVIMVAEK